jgi:hypothetical protein
MGTQIRIPLKEVTGSDEARLACSLGDLEANVR